MQKLRTKDLLGNPFPNMKKREAISKSFKSLTAENFKFLITVICEGEPDLLLCKDLELDQLISKVNFLLFEESSDEEEINVPCSFCKKYVTCKGVDYTCIHEECEKTAIELFKGMITHKRIRPSDVEFLVKENAEWFGLPTSFFSIHTSWIEVDKPSKLVVQTFSPYKKHLGTFGGSFDQFNEFLDHILKDECFCGNRRHQHVVDFGFFMNHFRKKTSKANVLYSILSMCGECVKFYKEEDHKEYLLKCENSIQVKNLTSFISSGKFQENKKRMKEISEKCMSCNESENVDYSTFSNICYGEKCLGLNGIFGYTYQVCRWCACAGHTFPQKCPLPTESPVCLSCFENHPEKVFIYKNPGAYTHVSLYDRTVFKKDKIKEPAFVTDKMKEIVYIGQGLDNKEVKKKKNAPEGNEFEKKTLKKKKSQKN